MKKLISLILAVLMIFSVTAVAAFAEDEAQKPVKITFIYDDADSTGLPVEKTKVIYVDYGEDFNSQVPEGSYLTKTADGTTYKIYTDVWSTDRTGYSGTLYEKGHFPSFAANDLVTEITFKADMASEKVTVGGVIEDAAESILGESTITFFNYIIEQIQVWFAQFILFLRNFA